MKKMALVLMIVLFVTSSALAAPPTPNPTPPAPARPELSRGAVQAPRPVVPAAPACTAPNCQAPASPTDHALDRMAGQVLVLGAHGVEVDQALRGVRAQAQAARAKANQALTVGVQNAQAIQKLDSEAKALEARVKELENAQGECVKATGRAQELCFETLLVKARLPSENLDAAVGVLNSDKCRSVLVGDNGTSKTWKMECPPLAPGKANKERAHWRSSLLQGDTVLLVEGERGPAGPVHGQPLLPTGLPTWGRVLVASGSGLAACGLGAWGGGEAVRVLTRDDWTRDLPNGDQEVFRDPNRKWEPIARLVTCVVAGGLAGYAGWSASGPDED